MQEDPIRVPGPASSEKIFQAYGPGLAILILHHPALLHGVGAAHGWN